MTREELKVHCEKQIESCEMWAKHKGEEPGGKVYEEHKLILELLEQEPKSEWEHDHEILKAYSDGVNEVLDKIRAEIKSLQNANPSYWHSGDMVDRDDVLEIIDKYREGVRDQE